MCCLDIVLLLTQIKLLEGRLQRDDVYLVLLEGITDRDAAGKRTSLRSLLLHVSDLCITLEVGRAL
jgi:hypothetical protein